MRGQSIHGHIVMVRGWEGMNEYYKGNITNRKQNADLQPQGFRIYINFGNHSALVVINQMALSVKSYSKISDKKGQVQNRGKK